MSPPLLLMIQLQLTYSRHCLEALVVSRLVLLGEEAMGTASAWDAMLGCSLPHTTSVRVVPSWQGPGLAMAP